MCVITRYGCSVAGFALFALWTTGTGRANEATLTTFDIPGISHPILYGINSKGDIVGMGGAEAGPPLPPGVLFTRAFVLSHGAVAVVTVPNATYLETAALGINSAGEVVGAYGDFMEASTSGFSWSAGAFTSMSIQGVSRANGINNHGAIVGFYARSRDDSHVHGFLRSDGVLTTIDYPGATATIANGINSRSEIVGSFAGATVDAYGQILNEGTHGFLLSKGAFTTIDVPGASNTFPAGINEHGDIVGYYYTGTYALPPIRCHGFLLSKGSFTTIDFPGADLTQLNGINDKGQIVGYYLNASGNHGLLLSK